MNGLKQCPFCGGEARIRVPSAKARAATAHVGGILPTLIECTKCGAVVSFDSNDSYLAAMQGTLREFTADAWNGRVSE